MAVLNGSNYDKAYVSVPESKIEVIEHSGKVRRMYDSYTIPSASELAASDTIRFFKLPKDAKIIDARLVIPVDGSASGILKVGWDDGVSDDGLFGVAEADFGAGAIDAKLLATAAGFNKSFTEETEIFATVTELTLDSGGNKIELELLYVVE